MEGDDVTGIPILRYAYKHWQIKNTLYTIAGISAERFGVGIPVMTLPEGSSEQDFTAAQSLVQNVRSNEESGIVLPSDKWKLDILIPKGRSSSGEDIKDQIEHHDLMILHAGLAAFLNLGTTDTGSFALSSDARGFFLTYVQDRMAYLAEQITAQVINRLLELNNMKPSKPIKLTFSNLGDKDKAATGQWITALANAGLIKIDSKMMEWIAKFFGMPELTDDDKDMMDLQEMQDNLPEPPPATEPTPELGEEEAPEEKIQEPPAPATKGSVSANNEDNTKAQSVTSNSSETIEYIKLGGPGSGPQGDAHPYIPHPREISGEAEKISSSVLKEKAREYSQKLKELKSYDVRYNNLKLDSAAAKDEARQHGLFWGTAMDDMDLNIQMRAGIWKVGTATVGFEEHQSRSSSYRPVSVDVYAKVM